MHIGFFKHHVFNIGTVDHHSIDKAHRLTVDFADQKVIGKRRQTRIKTITRSRFCGREASGFNLREQCRILDRRLANAHVLIVFLHAVLPHSNF